MYAIWTHFLSSLFNWGGDKKHVEISTQWNQEGRFFTADHIFIDPICAGWVVPELCRGEVIILQWKASPGLACVPGIEVATSGEGVQVPGVATMLLTWPSRCSWKPANRNHVNLVLQFCHVAFVLLRHPLVEIIQYHPCYRLSASGCRKFYLILELTRKFHLTFSWTHFKIKYWWLMLGAPLICAAQADML